METVWINGKKFEILEPDMVSEEFLINLEKEFFCQCINRCVSNLNWTDVDELSVDQLRGILYEIMCKREKMLGLDQCDCCTCVHD